MFDQPNIFSAMAIIDPPITSFISFALPAASKNRHLGEGELSAGQPGHQGLEQIKLCEQDLFQASLPSSDIERGGNSAPASALKVNAG
jgi:hypothetical protein